MSILHITCMTVLIVCVFLIVYNMLYGTLLYVVLGIARENDRASDKTIEWWLHPMFLYPYNFASKYLWWLYPPIIIAVLVPVIFK